MQMQDEDNDDEWKSWESGIAIEVATSEAAEDAPHDDEMAENELSSCLLAAVLLHWLAIRFGVRCQGKNIYIKMETRTE